MEKKKNVPVLRFPEFSGVWEKKKFCEIISESKLGGNYENSESNTGIPVIKMGNIGRGNINLDKVQYLPENEKYKEDDILKEGDLLFNTRNTLELVGKVSIWRNELPFALYNSNLMRMKFNDQIESSNNFMNYLFNIKNSIEQLRSFATGTTSVAAIYGKDLQYFNITFCTLSEQQKIASFISNIDEKLQVIKKKKTLLEQFKKGMMQKFFSQELRFKDEEGKDYPVWKRKKLGQIFNISAGGDIGNENVSQIRTEIFKYPIYANAEKNKGLYGFSDIYKIDGNVVTISGRGNLGIAHARDYKFYPIVRLLVLRPKNNENIFFFEYCINGLNIFSESTGVPQLTAPQISTYSISYPSLPEQTKIANFLSAIDDKINLCNAQIEKTEQWKKGLLQKMFV